VDGAELVGKLLSAAGGLHGLPVLFAYLYGSRTGDRARPDSDVDVAVALEPCTADPHGVGSRVADVLAGSGIGNVQVTVLDDAPIRFIGRVLRSRVVIYSRDEPARVEFESRVGRMADDVELWAAELDRELLAAIAEGRR
jgi:predicted nucleotidyltransferase